MTFFRPTARGTFVGVLPVLLPTLACAGANPDPTPAGYANPHVLVDTEWVLARLDDPTVRLVDVSRSADTYREGHLPGARHVRWDTDLVDPDDPVALQILSREALTKLMRRLGIENDHTIVLYDDASSLFAARAYWVLKYYRHGDVRIYDGGRIRWVAEGHDFADGGHGPVGVTQSLESGGYVAGEPDPEIATDWGQVVARIGDPAALICDTRTRDEHLGADVQAERGGAIPGAIHVEWSRAVREDGTFRDAAELHALYREAGFSPDKAVITYCQAGVRAAHTWFVLRELLGYPDVRNYDGSWAEYGNRADSPIRGPVMTETP
jgi:thiosulfate/3-mercaptopyruvate sulfurtransferase